MPGRVGNSIVPSTAEWLARTRGFGRFIAAQNNYNLLDRRVEAELAPACEQFGIGILPYFPLASGLLTGRYRRGEAAPDGSRMKEWGMESQLTDQRFDVIDQLQSYADERAITLLDVAIGGLAAQRAVGSVIAGATSPDQVAANVSAGAWVPSKEDRAALDAIVPSGSQVS